METFMIITAKSNDRRYYRYNMQMKMQCKPALESINAPIELGSIHGHSTVAIIVITICIAQEQYTDALLYIKIVKYRSIYNG